MSGPNNERSLWSDGLRSAALMLVLSLRWTAVHLTSSLCGMGQASIWQLLASLTEARKLQLLIVLFYIVIEKKLYIIILLFDKIGQYYFRHVF